MPSSVLSPPTTQSSEHALRIQALKEEMRARNLSALLIYSQRRGHVAYVSGYRPNYHTNSAFAIVPLDSNPVLIIRFGFDLERAKASSSFSDIRTLDPSVPETLVSKCIAILKEMKLDEGSIGYAAGDETVDESTVSLLAAIQEGLPRVTIRPVSDLLVRIRLNKSAWEVEQIRKATKIAEVAAEAVKEVMIPGTEDFEAWAAASAAALRAGAERCDLFISPYPRALAYPPLHQRFEMGAAISSELTIVNEGYWTQICRTYSLGEPSVTQKRLFIACRDAYESAINVARPGRRVDEMAEAIVQTLDRCGFAGSLTYGMGHGVGLDLPEPYEVEHGSHDTLTDGIVLVVHVGAWTPERSAAAFVGGPIIVGDKGTLPLDEPQREILII